MSAFCGPAHRLAFSHPLIYQVTHSGFGRSARDPATVPMRVAVVRQAAPVVLKVISQIHKVLPKPFHSLGVHGSQGFDDSSSATVYAAHPLDHCRPLSVPHLITKPWKLDPNRGRSSSVDISQSVRYVRAHLLNGPKDAC
jgi:hypothetical protein